ncbi:Lrp/AsnC family transcriptional regulator [Leucobacter sp. NPDC058333]|uniref:Lrp/AsnC family transcriptional regulator n=1 Tax=Leucobacter sp. NPDC058333 TaxID=3346450 RepID=UPI00365E03B7
MDAISREILSILQEAGRTSATELADQVGLSLSSCHRRVKELERSGAIERYRAIVSPAAVGLGFESVVFVTIGVTSVEVIAAFEKAVVQIADVVDVQRLFGEPDYILRVLTRDLASYQQLYDTVLSGLPGVQRLQSTLVMKRVGQDRGVPIP